MRVCFQGQAETPRQPEVSYLDGAKIVGQQDVAGLEVSVHYAPLVAVKQAVQHPPHHALDLANAQALLLGGPFVQIALHVNIQKFENQVQLLVTVQDVQKLHDRRVVQLLQQADLPEFDAGYALVRMLDLDLLERDSLKKRIHDDQEL